jgi:hypothetical protein
MKPKINLSGDGIKSFFFNNGEKLVLGITVLVLLLFLYSAITAKPLDDSKSPRAIASKADERRTGVQTPTEPPRVDFPPVDPRDPVAPPANYEAVQQQKEINPPIFQELHLRTEPEFFPVENLQVAAEVGIVPYRPASGVAGVIPQVVQPLGRPAIGAGHDTTHDLGNINQRTPLGANHALGAAGGAGAVAAPAAVPLGGASAYGVHAPGADPQPKGMAVITGLIPYEKQCEAYRREFELALPAGQVDPPIYQLFNVQRAEVKDAADTNLNWQNISYKTAWLDTQNWAVPPPTPELADPQTVCPPAPFLASAEAGGSQSVLTYVTWPLPPMYLKNWAPNSVHLKIPLFKAPEVAAPVAANPGGGIDFNAPAPVPGVAPGMNGAQAAQTLTPDVVNKLFRFVDLTAVPGKTYRYRVQLWLANPNFVNPSTQTSTAPLMERHLAKPQLGKLARRETAWSEPSPPITIPSVHRILADSIVTAGGRGAEPRAKIDILRIVKVPSANAAAAVPAPAPAPAGGAAPAAGGAPAGGGAPAAGAAAATEMVWLEVMKDTDVLLGGVAYLEGAAISNAFDPTIEQTRNLTAVTFDTNQSTLLDVRNDDALGAAAKSKGPAEMLFFEPRTGKLVAVSSATDSAVKKLYKDRTTPSADGGPGPVFVPGPGPGPAPAPVPPNNNMRRRGDG